MLTAVLTVVDCDGSPAAARAVGRALEAVLRGPAAAVLPLPAGPAAVRARLASGLRATEPAGPEVALVVATSGSTGQPKGVELSAEALLASATATQARLGGPGRWLLALPAEHIAGVQVLVRSLLAGHEPAVLDLRPGFTARAFAALAADMPADHRRYTALVPTQLGRLLDAAERADRAGLAELRGFDAVLVGGAACPPALLSRARAAGVRVFTTYGLSETSGGCVYDGQPLDGVRVRLADRGRVELAGPVLALGYRLGTAAQSRSATAAAFHGGWFSTEDAGSIGPDGRLRVSGRLDDLIVTGGRKVAPALVEQALAAVPGVGEVCVVGLPDDEWGQLVAAAVVARDPASPPDPAALRGAARALAGSAAGPRLIRLVPALPLRGPGKVDRAEVRRLLTVRDWHSAGNHPPVTR